MAKKNKKAPSKWGGFYNPADTYEQILRDHATLSLQGKDLPIFPDQRLGVALDVFIELHPNARQLPDTPSISEAILDAMQEKKYRGAVTRHAILYTDDRQVDYLVIRRFLKTGEKEGIHLYCWEL